MKVTVAAAQFACSGDRVANLATAERTVREPRGKARTSS
jgi:predicted amidohydrolase